MGDFDINIGIKLDDSNLSSQLKDLQTKINKDINGTIKLKLDFGNTINESIKSITNISNQVTNLSKQVNELNNTSNKKIQIIDGQNFINEINEITKATRSLKDIKSELSSLGDLKIKTGEIDDGGMRTFIATVKEASGRIAELQFRLKEGIQGSEEHSLYEFQGFKSFTDGTNKVLNDLDKFKSEYQQKLEVMKNDFKNIDFTNNDSIKNFENQLNSLDINTFKQKSQQIKNTFKDIESNLKDIDNFKETYNNKIDNFRSNSQYILPQQINNLQSQVNGLNGTESTSDLKLIEQEYNNLTERESVYANQAKEDTQNINKQINEEIQLYNTLANQEERLKNIRSSYNTKLDVNTEGYKQLESIYNSLIKDIEQYRQDGKALSVEESTQLKSDINDLMRKKNSILEITNAIKQQEQALESLKSKFGNLINDSEINNIKSQLQGLGASANFKGDRDNITQQIADLKELATQRQRIQGLGTNLGSISSTGLNFNSSVSEIQTYLKSIESGKIQFNQLSESVDNAGNKIKQIHYTVDQGHGLFSMYKLSVDSATGSVYKLDNGIMNMSMHNKSFGDTLKSAMESVTGFSLISGAYFTTISAIKDMIVYTGQMDNSLVSLNKVVDMSKSQLDGMKDSALELGQTLGKDSVSIMDSMAEAGRQFKNPEDIKKFTETAVMASNVTDMTAQQAAKSLTTVMKVFKQGINDVQGDLNSFNEIQNNYRVSGEDLAHSIEKVGEAAAQTGTNMHELNGVTTALVEATGLEGSEAGTSIRAILSRTFGLGRDGADGKGMKALKDIAGVDVRDASGQFKSFSEILKETNDAWGNLSKNQQFALAQAEGGVQHYSQFMTIMENYKTVVDATNSSINSQDSALNENAKYLQSTEGKIGQLKASAEKLANDFISSETTKGFIDFAKGITSGADSIIKTFGSIPSVVALASTALLGFNKNLQIFSNVNGKLQISEGVKNSLENYTNAYIKNLQVIQSNNNTLMQTPTLLERTSASMKTLTSSTIGQTIATTALNAVIGMGIGLAIGVIIEKITKWINKNQELNQSIDESIAAMKSTQDNVNNIDNLIKKYEELNNTTNKSKEQNDELVSIQKQLAQVLPEATTKYDEQNQALATNIDRVKELNKEQKEGLKTKAITTINLIDPDDMKKQLSEAQKTKKELEDALSNPNTDKKWYKAEGDLLPSYGKDAREKMAKDLGEEQKNIEDLNKKVQSYNQAVDILNSLGDKQYTKINLVSDATKNNTDIKNANTQATQAQAKSVDDLNKSFQDASNNINDYAKYIKEMNQNNGSLSAESLKEIAKTHADLIPYLGDEKTLYNKIQQAIEDEKKTALDAYGQIIENSTDFYNTNIKGTDKTQTALGDYYKNLTDKQKQDLANATTIAQAKEVVEMQVIADLEKAWADYFAQVDKELQSLGGLSGNDQTDDVRQMQAEKNASHTQSGQTALDSAKKYNNDLAGIEQRFNDLKNSFSSSIIDKMDGTTEGVNKVTKATKANATEIDKAKDSVRNYEIALKDHDNTIYSLESQLSGMNDSSDKYRQGLQTEIDLLKEKNSTLNDAISTNQQYADSLNTKVGSGNATGSASSLGNSLGSQIVAQAQKYLGTPYVWGGENTQGFDCSGLVQYVMKQLNISVGRTTYDQVKDGVAVSKQDLQPGDLVFYGDPSTPHHVGIYVGNDQMIESPKTGENVRISSIERSDYATARRVTGVNTSSNVNSSNSSMASEADSITSTIDGWQKQIIDNNKKIDELYTQIYTSQIKAYDEQEAHVNRNGDMAKTMYDLYKNNDTEEGLTKAEQYKEQVWKEINWRYSVLVQKENYINSQLASNVYDEKTKTDMEKALEEVRIEKQKTIVELHQEFQSWQKEMYDNSIRVNNNNIDELQSKLDILDKASTKNYDEKINLNNEILVQENQIKQKTLDRITALQKLIDVEKDDNSREIWINEQDTLIKQLDVINSKTVEIEQKNIELAKNKALDKIEKQIYNGQTEKQFENYYKSQINALDDQLEVMQKQSEVLAEQEQRKKNLLDLAEAQIKLQDEQANKSVQQLTKDKSGNWQFQYVANQQNVDSLQKEVRDKIVSNNDWERQTAEKHREEAINLQKQELQQEIDIRNQAYNTIKSDLDTALANGNTDIMGTVNNTLAQLNIATDSKFKPIVTDIINGISSISSVLTTFSSNIAMAQANLNNIKTTAINTAGIISPTSSEHITSTSTNSNGAAVVSMMGQGGGYVKVTYSDGSSKTIKQYENGTNSAEGGLSLVGEEGAELRILNKGDGIIPTSITENLLKLGTNPVGFLKDLIPDLKSLNLHNIILPNIKMPDFGGIINKASQSVTNSIHLDNLTLECPNIVDGESFIQALKELPNSMTQMANNVYDK